MVDEERDWAVRQGLLNGKPIVTSFRTSVNTDANLIYLPYQIGIAVPLLNPTEVGLPTDSEAQFLWRIEDELKSKLGTEYAALYVMSITTNGMREFVFYTPEWKPQEIERSVKDIENKLNDGHELQFLLQEDRNWRTYTEFIPQDSN